MLLLGWQCDCYMMCVQVCVLVVLSLFDVLSSEYWYMVCDMGVGNASVIVIVCFVSCIL